MKYPIALSVVLVVGALTLGGCKSVAPAAVENNSSKTQDSQPDIKIGDQITLQPSTDMNSPARMIPKALIYKMSGEYADNVPITLNDQRTAPLSFPAPGDLGAFARPLPLAGGYWLDRRGISANSVFTCYTYAEYAALPQAPAIAELMASVIPGAVITEIVQLPVTVSAAVNDTAAVNSMINQGLKDCKVLYQVPVFKK